jgi:hypothetical protein
MTIDHLTHLLDKKVPDMSRGLRIETHYGEIDIPAGNLAERIKDLVAQHFTLELMRAEEIQRQQLAAEGSAAA